MPETLYVTDLDCTLLGADSLVSAGSCRMLNQAIARGALFSVATARTPATVVPLLSDVDCRLPQVVITGSAMWDPVTARYLEVAPFPADDALFVGETMMECGLTPLVYKMGDNGVLNLYHPIETSGVARQFLEERSRLSLKKLFPDGNLRQRLADESSPMVLVLAIGAREQVKRAVEILEKSQRPLSVAWYSDPVYTGAYFLEVFGKDVSKAYGIRRLRELTGAGSVTVFGDNYNDLPMAAEADRFIAVENAVDDVKAAADLVIGPNTSDSVARFILDETR